jgi:hypothetical protein
MAYSAIHQTDDGGPPEGNGAIPPIYRLPQHTAKCPQSETFESVVALPMTPDQAANSHTNNSFGRFVPVQPSRANRWHRRCTQCGRIPRGQAGWL